MELRILTQLPGEDLDEHALSQLKDHLVALSADFRAITGYFAFPITMDMAANAYMLIGSACFLIINQDRGMQPYTAGFIANIGLFAFARLCLVAGVGNLATQAAATLARRVYEVKSEWTLPEWLYYLEIKRQTPEFRVSIASVYSVQQSSILTLLGFALNYVVILLQTENYGASSRDNNGTILKSETKIFNN